MRMQTNSQPGRGGFDVHTVEFSELGAGVPKVTLVIAREEWDGGSIEGGVQQITIEGSMLTNSEVAKIAEILPGLTATALQAVSHEMPVELIGGVISGGRDSGVPGEVARAALIYRRAVQDGRRPLQAVMNEMNLAKATASRRIRAAKDAGLIDTQGGAQ